MGRVTERREGTELGRVEVGICEFLASCLEWGVSEHASWPSYPLFL